METFENLSNSAQKFFYKWSQGSKSNLCLKIIIKVTQDFGEKIEKAKAHELEHKLKPQLNYSNSKQFCKIYLVLKKTRLVLNFLFV